MDALLWAGRGFRPNASSASSPPLAARSMLPGSRCCRAAIPSRAGCRSQPRRLTAIRAMYSSAPGNCAGGQRRIGARPARQPPAARAPPARSRKMGRGTAGQCPRRFAAGDPRGAVRIAAEIDDAFDPGADISDASLGLRDDYTSLIWLGGTEALWNLGERHCRRRCSIAMARRRRPRRPARRASTGPVAPPPRARCGRGEPLFRDGRPLSRPLLWSAGA